MGGVRRGGEVERLFSRRDLRLGGLDDGPPILYGEPRLGLHAFQGVERALQMFGLFFDGHHIPPRVKSRAGSTGTPPLKPPPEAESV
jgi:hypothetical protein